MSDFKKKGEIFMRLTCGRLRLKTILTLVLALVIAVSGIASAFPRISAAESFVQSTDSVADNSPLSHEEIIPESDNLLYLRSSFRKLFNRYFKAFGIKSRISAAEIEIDRQKLSLAAGTSAIIDADIIPSNAKNREVIFRSNNPRVASVDIFGIVKALKPGTATVYAIAGDGGFYRKCLVTVTPGRIYCDSVALSSSGISLDPGASEAFDVTVFPVNTTDPEALFVSDTDIVNATLLDGRLTVTGKTPGTAIVTVKCGDFCDSLYVNVNDPDNPAGGIEPDCVEIFGGSSASGIGTIFRSMASMPDGGYVACGTTASVNGNFKHLYRDFFGWKAPFSYIAKFSETGRIEWIELFGEASSYVTLYDIAVLSDGSIAAVGTYDTPSTTEQAGGIDAAVIRLSSDGLMLSKNILKGSGDDFFYSVAATADGYVVGGKTNSMNGAFEGVPGMSAIVMSYDMNNNLLWKRYFNASKSSHIADIDVDGENNIFLACTTTATDGDFSEFDGLFGGYADSVIFKFSGTGELLWSHVIATSGTDLFESIAADGSGGCYVAGNYTLVSATEPDGTLEGMLNCGGTDALVLRLDQNGERLWCKILSGFYNDFATDIVRTDNGIGVTGYSESENREFSSVGNMGGTDAFFCFYDSDGNRIEIKSKAGTNDDAGICIAYSAFSDEIFIAGRTKSTDCDFADNSYGSSITGFVTRHKISS